MFDFRCRADRERESAKSLSYRSVSSNVRSAPLSDRIKKVPKMESWNFDPERTKKADGMTQSRGWNDDERAEIRFDFSARQIANGVGTHGASFPVENERGIRNSRGLSPFEQALNKILDHFS